MPIESTLLNQISNVRHSFGDLKNEIPFGKDSFASKKQNHGNISKRVFSPNDQLGECDGVYTDVRGQPVSVISADCVPVLLAKKDGSKVAAIHAGWRGTFAQITKEFWQLQLADGEKAGDWVAAIGPSIRACCYEVSVELIQSFSEKFGKSYDVSRFLDAGTRKLDLAFLNELELNSFGIDAVELCAPCTFCSKDENGEPIYHSFRREKASVRQCSVIQIL